MMCLFGYVPATETMKLNAICGLLNRPRSVGH